MIPYWVLFLFSLLAVFSNVRGDAQVRALAFGMFASIATAMIGLRYKVGGDWNAYSNYVSKAGEVGLLEAITLNDPAYMAINWLSAKLGLGIAGVNLIGGVLFIYGLLRFCRQQPFPWLGVTVATPFLLIVVGMGYSRQAIALGFVFWAISVWSQKNFFQYVALVFVAALFHKTAAVMFFLALFINNRHLLAKCFLALPVLAYISYLLIVTSTFDAAFNSYIIQGDYESQGGIIRILMNIVPATILLLLYRRFSLFDDNRLWLLITGLCLVSFPLVFKYSTVVDRLALYLAPIQVAVYSRLPVFVKDRLWRTLLVTMILMMYAIILFIWLNYAVHAEYWLPYRWVLNQ